MFKRTIGETVENREGARQICIQSAEKALDVTRGGEVANDPFEREKENRGTLVG